MEWVLLLCIASLSLSAGLPRVLVAQEAKENELMKHVSEWADVKYVQVTDLISNGEAEAFVVDGMLYSKYAEELHSVLLRRDIPIVIMDMTAEQKDVIVDQMTFGTLGSSYIYSVLPFTDRNRVRHHRVIDVPVRPETSENSKNSTKFMLNLDESAKMFSDEIFACVTNGVFSPATNMTPPQGALYAIMPNTILGTYTVDLSEMSKPGSQTVSHRLDNTFYNYRQNGFQEDAYYTVLLQDGIVSPGTLIIQNPSQAIGFFQYLFAVSNQPYPLGVLPHGGTYFWAQSSPATVDQTISVTDSVSDTLSLEIDMTVDGPSTKISETWTASTSVTSEISQWGILEDTNPINSTTAWTYHQQLPYDPFELNWYNFGSWYSAAYNGGNVNVVPDLSTNTLQVHTISAWYASGTLRSSSGSLPVLTTTNRAHQVAIVCTPDYYNGHHHAEWYPLSFSDQFKMDLNSFPSSTSKYN